MDSKAPDIVLLGTERRERAPLRAQLIEQGYDVVAIDAWPMPRLYRRPGMKPRLLIVDLHELPQPRDTLDEVRFVLPADRVLVLTALGTLSAADVRRFGFNIIERPVTIGDIVHEAARLLSQQGAPHATQPNSVRQPR